MRTTLAAVNQELAKRGYTAPLARASGYFYFHFGEAADWLDRTVPVSDSGQGVDSGSPGSSGMLALIDEQSLKAVSDRGRRAVPK